MSNTIQIKRGAGKPDGKLAPYELGYDINSKLLYIGGDLVDDDSGNGIKKYGQAQGIKVTEAMIADTASKTKKIINNNGEGLTLGSKTTPIFLQNGEFQPCGGSSISGTIEKAEMLATPRQIGVNLTLNTYANFNGQQNIETGVTGILPVSKGGTGANTAEEARKTLGITPKNIGAALAADLDNYVPLENGGIKLASKNLTSDQTEWLITLESLAYDQISNNPINFGTGIKFHVYKNNEERWSGIEGYAATGWGNQTGLRFTTHSLTGTEYVATFAEGKLKINGETVYPGKRFTELASNKTINSNNATITIYNVNSYSGFIFYATTSGSSNSDGIVSVTIPAAILSENETKFVLCNRADSKIFSVKIIDGTMTITNIGYEGNGIEDSSFCVYGIK